MPWRELSIFLPDTQSLVRETQGALLIASSVLGGFTHSIVYQFVVSTNTPMDERALALFLYVPIVVVIARCKIHKEMGPPCCLALVGYVGVVMSSQQFALLTIPIVGLLGRLVYSWPLATRGD